MGLRLGGGGPVPRALGGDAPGRVVVVAGDEVAAAVGQAVEPAGRVVVVVDGEPRLVDALDTPAVLVGELEEPAAGVRDLRQQVRVVGVGVLQGRRAGRVAGTRQVAVGIVVVVDVRG